MFISIAVATLIATSSAPIPKETPATSGMAPRVVEIKPSPEGKIMITIRREEKIKMNVGRPIGGANPAPAVQPVERSIYRTSTVEIGDVKDLKITTASGKSVELKDAIEKLKDGGIVVMTSDGKPVDLGFLRVFKDETLVFTSPELVGTGVANSSTGVIIKPLPQPLPIQPGGIQVLPLVPGGAQVLPGVIQPVPAEKVKD